MANAYTTDPSTIPAYYEKRFLQRLVPAIAMYDIVEKRTLPENSGTTIYFPRMSASSTTLSAYKSTAGTIVSTEAVNDLRLSAVVEKYRNSKAIWDIVKLTGLSTYIDEVVDEQADHAALLIDKRILEECYGTSTGSHPTVATPVPTGLGFSCYVWNATGNTDLGTSVSSFPTYAGTAEYGITAETIRKAVQKLRARNVKPYDDGFYKFVVHTDTEMAIQADSTWQATYQYTDPENMKKGIFGKYAGCKMIRDNQIYTSANGSAGATLYYSVLLGKGSLASSELGGGIKTYMKESGPQDTFNPVNEFVSFGWKIMFVPKMINISCGLLVISAD